MSEDKSFASFLTDDNLVFIENDYLRLGANLSLGGALTHLSEKGKKNLLNSADWGRQVQMSFYAYPVPFHPDGFEMAENWHFIGWNPIQSGDCYRNRSKVLEYRCEDNEIYVKCIPMHWPLNNHPGECTFEVWYRLDGYCVNVTSRINNARPDTAQYPARHQELPVYIPTANGTRVSLTSESSPLPMGRSPSLSQKKTILAGPGLISTRRKTGLHWSMTVTTVLAYISALPTFQR
ncbi:MAG: hypothetical protein IKM04_08085 [Clostridia bacterium]|nr:hypothetical protein [Clostridia bacterium]